MKVLLALDDRLRGAWAPELRRRGWELLACQDVQTGLVAARRESPAVVVVAERFPGGGGVTMVTRLRSLIGTALTPVVAAGDPSTHEALLAAGATCCVTPDAAPDQVAAALDEAVGRPPQPVVEVAAELLDEPGRVSVLERTGLVPGDGDAFLDDVTCIAADLLPVPTSLVSLVDGSEQYFPGRTDVSPRPAGKRTSPRSESFCQWAVTSGEVLVVEDAADHPVLRHSPAVDGLGVTAYAGIPLVVEGEALGTVCAVDYEQRHWDEEDVTILRLLAQVTTAELHLRLVGSQAGDGRLRGLAGAVKHGMSGTTRILSIVRPAPDREAYRCLLRLLERLTWRLPATADASRAGPGHG